MTDEQKQALDSVVQHFWQEELDDFRDSDEDTRKDHVFRDLATLDNFVNGMTCEPENYLLSNVTVTIVTPEQTEADIPF